MNLINLQEAHRKWVDFSELHQKKTVYWSYFTAWTIILTSEREEAEWLRMETESSAVRSII